MRRGRLIRTTIGLTLAGVAFSLAGISGARANSAIGICEPNAPASNVVVVCVFYDRAPFGSGVDQFAEVRAGSPKLNRWAFVATECFNDGTASKDFYVGAVYITGVANKRVFETFKPIAGMHCPGI